MMSELLRAVSTKADGNLSLRHESDQVVLPKRELFLAKHGVSSKDCVFIQTEHGDNIAHVDVSNKGQSIPTEALITKDKGVVLFLLTGDCFPVSFYDPVEQVIALAHLGWKPTDKGLVIKVIKEMENMYGSRLENISMFIGPGIQNDSYKFENPIQKELPDWSDYLKDVDTGETVIDLVGYIEAQAINSGVLPENIDISSVDTATSDEYFSHYRSIRTGEPEARFATIIGLITPKDGPSEGYHFISNNN